MRATVRESLTMISCPPVVVTSATCASSPRAAGRPATGIRPSTCRRWYIPAKSDALAFLATKVTDILRGEWTAPAAGKVGFGEFVDQRAPQ